MLIRERDSLEMIQNETEGELLLREYHMMLAHGICVNKHILAHTANETEKPNTSNEHTNKHIKSSMIIAQIIPSVIRILLFLLLVTVYVMRLYTLRLVPLLCFFSISFLLLLFFSCFAHCCLKRVLIWAACRYTGIGTRIMGAGNTEHANEMSKRIPGSNKHDVSNRSRLSHDTKNGVTTECDHNRNTPSTDKGFPTISWKNMCAT